MHYAIFGFLFEEFHVFEKTWNILISAEFFFTTFESNRKLKGSFVTPKQWPNLESKILGWMERSFCRRKSLYGYLTSELLLQATTISHLTAIKFYFTDFALMYLVCSQQTGDGIDSRVTDLFKCFPQSNDAQLARSLRWMATNFQFLEALWWIDINRIPRLLPNAAFDRVNTIFSVFLFQRNLTVMNR